VKGHWLQNRNHQEEAHSVPGKHQQKSTTIEQEDKGEYERIFLSNNAYGTEKTKD
jgi:hypothetical protein